MILLLSDDNGLVSHSLTWIQTTLVGDFKVAVQNLSETGAVLEQKQLIESIRVHRV